MTDTRTSRSDKYDDTKRVDLAYATATVYATSYPPNSQPCSRTIVNSIVRLVMKFIIISATEYGAHHTLYCIAGFKCGEKTRLTHMKPPLNAKASTKPSAFT